MDILDRQIRLRFYNLTVFALVKRTLSISMGKYLILQKEEDSRQIAVSQVFLSFLLLKDRRGSPVIV